MRLTNEDPTLDPDVGYRDGYEDGETAAENGDMQEYEEVRLLYEARQMTGYQLAYCEGFQDGYDDTVVDLFSDEDDEEDGGFFEGEDY